MLNKTNILKMFGIGSMCLFLLGCSEESFLMQEKTSDVMVEENSGIKITEEQEFLQKEDDDVSEEQISSDKNRSDDNEEANSQVYQREIAVHICGAVNQPGVYYLKENQRLYEAVAKAGGFREDADEDYLNQALILEDGMKVVVPTIAETTVKNEMKEIGLEEKEESLSKSILTAQESEKTALEEGFLHKKEGTDVIAAQESKIDLNTADETLLCTLPGIGESRAKSIIAYRQENGPFRSPEDVMNVSGIKEAAYEKIKDYIMVSD